MHIKDVVIPAETEEEGLQHLKGILDTASNYGLEINFKKCLFSKRNLQFWGITEHGILAPSPMKSKAIQNFPEPKNDNQPQTLFGIIRCFRKFVPKYAFVTRLLVIFYKIGDYRIRPKSAASITH